MRHHPLVCGCKLVALDLTLLCDWDNGGSQALKSLNMGSQQLCFKVRIRDQIAIKSILDRHHIYLAGKRQDCGIWRFGHFAAAVARAVHASRVSQHVYSLSGYI